jgi:hypothetical protein
MFTEYFDPEHCTSYRGNIFMYNIIANRLGIPIEMFDEKFIKDVYKRVYDGIGTKISIHFNDELHKFPYENNLDNKKILLELFNSATRSPFYMGHKTGGKDQDIQAMYFLLDEELENI